MQMPALTATRTSTGTMGDRSQVVTLRLELGHQMRQSTATPDDLHRMTRMLREWAREREGEREMEGGI